jgi:hypothetical protein
VRNFERCGGVLHLLLLPCCCSSRRCCCCCCCCCWFTRDACPSTSSRRLSKSARASSAAHTLPPAPEVGTAGSRSAPAERVTGRPIGAQTLGAGRPSGGGRERGRELATGAAAGGAGGREREAEVGRGESESLKLRGLLERGAARRRRWRGRGGI